MKYGIDMGHNCYPDTGASGIRFEDDLTKEVGLKVIDKLQALGHSVIRCNPSSATTVGDSLNQRCSIANNNNVDLYVSIHFNAGGGRGTEVFAASQLGRELAQKVVDSIASLGFVNRGVKDGSRLYVIRNTNAVAILVECAFVDSKEDMDRYNGEAMANAIVKGLTGSVPNPVPTPMPTPTPTPTPQPQNPPSIDNGVLVLQRILNRLRIRDGNGNSLAEDGIMGQNTKSAVIKFQSILGLTPDGIVGPITQSAISTILNKPLLGINYKNPIATKYLQWRLGLSNDGIFGPNTKYAVTRFQSNNGLVADGIVGPVTWGKLIG